MEFIRRLYYEVFTGKLLLFYSIADVETVGTSDSDFERQPELAPYADSPDLVGLLEWTEPDEEIEWQFENMHCTGVDVTVTPHRPVFEEYGTDGSDEVSMIIDFLQGGQETLELPEKQLEKLTALRGTIDAVRSVLTEKQLAEVNGMCASQGIRWTP